MKNVNNNPNLAGGCNWPNEEYLGKQLGISGQEIVKINWTLSSGER